MEKPKFDGIEKYIFSEVYMFLTKYIDGDGSQQFWETCVNDARQLCKKYYNNKLCLNLTIAAMMDIEYKLNKSADDYGRVYTDWEILKDSIKNNKLK